MKLAMATLILLSKQVGSRLTWPQEDMEMGFRLGILASSAVKPETEFNLQTADVDLDSIKVFLDGVPTSFTYVHELNQVHLNEETTVLSQVDVQYCPK